MDKGGFDSNTFFSTIVTDMITDGEWVKGISYSKTKIVFTNNAELNFIFFRGNYIDSYHVKFLMFISVFDIGCQVEIGLGRHPVNFTVGFTILFGSEDFDAAVAIDKVRRDRYVTSSQTKLANQLTTPNLS